MNMHFRHGFGEDLAEVRLTRKVELYTNET